MATRKGAHDEVKTLRLPVMKNKLVYLASIGAGLEYYDFVVCGLLAGYLAKAFFPQTDPMVASLQAFGLFSLGYFTRPLGGIIFGHLGDRYGRRAVFLWSMILMAIATLSMGLLPTHFQLGGLATLGLILLRALQGIAFGAELPGVMTFLMEHGSAKTRSFHGGVMLAGVSAGALLASGLLFFLAHFFSDPLMQRWGWRLPFLVGGALAVVAYTIRTSLPETPLFLQAQTTRLRWPVCHLMKQFPLRILMGVGVAMLSASLCMFQISLPVFLHQVYGFETSDVYLAITFSFMWAVLILPVVGRGVDRVGRAKLLMYLSILLAVSCFAIFTLLNNKNFISLLCFILLLQSFTCAAQCASLPLLAELFPTPVRLSGTAFCYNTVHLLASLLPILLGQWISWFGNMQHFYLVFIGLSLIVFCSAVWAHFNVLHPNSSPSQFQP
ncbi:MAG: MFS transporter [Gammaproteobacteria bacterium]|nr:MFS transporter [Gammaproteobacteria bacterium]